MSLLAHASENREIEVSVSEVDIMNPFNPNRNNAELQDFLFIFIAGSEKTPSPCGWGCERPYR